MLGAIAGDVIGSIYEVVPIKSTTFPLFDECSRFTDDTVLTVATAAAILRNKPYDVMYRDFGRRYPRAGYGASFYDWLRSDDPEPYGSFGNGSAMRVSPVGFAYDDEQTVLREAERSASATHNHREGVRGAQAVALAVLKARLGESREQIRDGLTFHFGYDFDRSIAEIRPGYSFDVTCQGSVPEALIAFFESTDVESAIRIAISLGGDSDTLAAIAGSVAHAYYAEIPDSIVTGVRQRLPTEFLEVIDEFTEKYVRPGA